LNQLPEAGSSICSRGSSSSSSGRQLQQHQQPGQPLHQQQLQVQQVQQQQWRQQKKQQQQQQQQQPWQEQMQQQQAKPEETRTNPNKTFRFIWGYCGLLGDIADYCGIFRRIPLSTCTPPKTTPKALSNNIDNI